MARKIFVGVDGGGTKCKLVLQSEDGETLGSGRGGPASIRLSVENSWISIHDAFGQACQQAGLSFDDSNVEFHAGMGLAGTEIRSAMNAFLKTPHPFKTLLLESDAHTACLGAHNGRDGAIIIIGTGVIGYEIVHKQVVRIGGWGFPHGDEGGGAWLGLEAIRLMLHMIDGRIKSTPLLDAIFGTFDRDVDKFSEWVSTAKSSQFGEFAPMVLEYVKQDGPFATKLISKAGHHINAVAHALEHRSLEDNIPFALFGGIAPFIRPYLDDDIQARIVERKHDATIGAIILLRQHLGLPLL